MTKLSRSHSTYIDRAEPILKKLKKNPNISKISLGIIRIKYPPAKSHGKFKISVNEKYILLNVNSKASNQEIRIYGKDLESIKEYIEASLDLLRQEYISQ